MRVGVVVLALLFVVGVPAVVALSLSSQGAGIRPKSGQQPGGKLSGVVEGDGATLADVRVEVVGLATSGARTPLGTTRTNADGAFEIEAPAFDGIYELVAGSGAWRAAAEPASFVGRDGQAQAPEPIRFRLTPGAELTLTVTRRDGRAPGSGKWTLSSRQPGAFLMMGTWQDVASGTLDAGRLHADALPIGPAKAVLRLDSGERVEVDVELAHGAKSQVVEI